jgi:hypothetical protein
MYGVEQFQSLRRICGRRQTYSSRQLTEIEITVAISVQQLFTNTRIDQNCLKPHQKKLTEKILAANDSAFSPFPHGDKAANSILK